jgi:EmrB/QacA subfamily drug resistance transporter
VLALAQFMVFLDETVVNVALPSIKGDLGFSQSGLAWVVSAYILVFGGLLLAGGRIADLLGRRRIFLIGTAAFGSASLLGGLATSQGTLLGARVLQGVGAALATPAALSLVASLFPAGAQRVKALGIWGALAGLGFTAGMLLGGTLTEAASWRWVFFINVPVAGAALGAVPRLVRESRAVGPRGFDLAGGLTLTAALTALVYALVRAPANGWRSPLTEGILAGAALLLGAFALIERRTGTPLAPRGLLHRRATLVPSLLQMLLGAAGISALFLLTLYIQQVLGYSPLQAGLAYLPLAAGVASTTAVANHLLPRLGPRPLAAVGLFTIAAGLARLGHVPVAGDYATDVLPSLLVIGLGAGLSFSSITAAALGRVGDAASGLVSGLLSASGQIGGALGVAVLVSVMSERASGLLGAGTGPLAAQVAGLRLAFLVGSGIALAGSLVAAFALESRKAGELGRTRAALKETPA